MITAHRILIVCLLPLAARAGTSADYSISTAFPEEGGGEVASIDYRINTAAGPGEAVASTDFSLRGGYAGQLADVISIRIDGPTPLATLREAQATQLGVAATLDDATKSVLAADAVKWTMQGGPATVGPSGMVTAAHVYQDTEAGVAAGYLNFSDTFSLVVLNSGTDDFSSYAADGLPDRWQVQYFGESGIQTAAGEDADSDGLTNLQEYAFGMNPSVGSIGMMRWSGSNLLERGGPTLFAIGTAGSFTFRAVFARRKDFAAAGLSYTVEFSGDLSTWQASTSTPSILAEDSEIQVVSVPYPFFVNGQKSAYFRVRVQSE
jgi:hypothetical protein